MIQWLNSNSGAVTALATVVLVIITGFYAYATFRQLSVASALRTAQVRPLIHVFIASIERVITPEFQLVYTFTIVMGNDSPAPALNLQLEILVGGVLNKRGFVDYPFVEMPDRRAVRNFDSKSDFPTVLPQSTMKEFKITYIDADGPLRFAPKTFVQIDLGFSDSERNAYELSHIQRVSDTRPITENAVPLMNLIPSSRLIFATFRDLQRHRISVPIRLRRYRFRLFRIFRRKRRATWRGRAKEIERW